MMMMIIMMMKELIKVTSFANGELTVGVLPVKALSSVAKAGCLEKKNT